MNNNFLETAAAWWASFGGAATSLLRIALIVVLAWVAVLLLQRAIRTLRMRIASRMDDREATKRAETLGRVFRYLVAVVVSLIAGMLVLGELGVSVAPILGAAGVVGLAVGFGAQSLVKDYFTGFFLLLENQIRQGDVVKLGDHAGLVEVVTLRYVQLARLRRQCALRAQRLHHHRGQHDAWLQQRGAGHRRGLPRKRRRSDGRHAAGGSTAA